MNTSSMNTRIFHPNSRTSIITTRKLPHWSQAGALTYITWRTHYSIPKEIYQQWVTDRNQFLKSRGIDPDSTKSGRGHISNKLSPEDRKYFHREFSRRWNDALDDCHGECLLRDPACADIVRKSLLHFDEDRYLLDCFVIMPNHAHLVVAFPDEEIMLKQCESWKLYTGRGINRKAGKTGRFWQQDGFDHLVRSEAQLDKIRKYIEDNPRKANLNAGEYCVWKREYSSLGA